MITTYEALIERLISTKRLTKERVITAFKKIDRASFVPSEEKEYCYYDEALPIGYQQTISQPTTVAIMLELLDVGKGHDVCDVGSGSGWTTALLAELVGSQGHVLGLERVAELVTMGQQNIEPYQFEHVSIQQAGTLLGVPGQTFDRILVSASASTFPSVLLDQLRDDGKLVIPVKQSLLVVHKKKGRDLHIDRLDGFVFVPLVVEEGAC